MKQYIRKLLAGLAVLGCAAAHAETWPSRPITMIVSYPPGGGADVMARLVAPRMAEILGVPIVIENKPGGGGQIAGGYVANARPDGYTIMADASSFSINPFLYKHLPYDTGKAFAPLGVLSLHPQVLLVNPEFQAKTVADYIQDARRKPGDLVFASSGNGSGQHMAGALFEVQAGVKLLHVPYKGGGPAMNDLMAGQVPSSFGNVASSINFIKANRLRALAITGKHRTPALPDVPTMSESGVQGCEAYEWIGLFAPAGTPPEVLRRLAEAVQQAKESPEFRARVQDTGGEVFPGGADAAASFIDAQMQQWSRVIKEKHITIG